MEVNVVDAFVGLTGEARGIEVIDLTVVAIEQIEVRAISFLLSGSTRMLGGNADNMRARDRNRP